MAGKKVIITGVPGVGKTTVINEALQKLKSEGVDYQPINFGTFMISVITVPRMFWMAAE
jgi:Archaeal adenylate kinase